MLKIKMGQRNCVHIRRCSHLRGLVIMKKYKWDREIMFTLGGVHISEVFS